MTLWQAIVLGALQGATEFLPVSSSGHLVIVPELLGWPAAGLHFSVAVHWATALAVVLYFRDDWKQLLSGTVRGGWPWRSSEGRLLLLIVAASVPAAVAGLWIQDPLDQALTNDSLGSARIAAAMLLVTGAILLAAELVARRRSSGGRTEDVGLGGATFVGFAQATALIPGISRSGATMSAGMMVGLRRDEAARFSFLLATPVILGAGLLQLGEFALGGTQGVDMVPLAAGAVTAFVTGYAVIVWLMRYLRRAPLYPFVVYTWIVGLLVLWWLR